MSQGDNETIIVLRSGCLCCQGLAGRVEAQLAQLGWEIPVHEESNILEILRYAVPELPCIVYKGSVLAYGEGMSDATIREALSSVMPIRRAQ